MSNTTPHAPTLNGVPHLGRAEAVLYVLLYFLFSYIHPRYQRYIDALAAHDRMGLICARPWSGLRNPAQSYQIFPTLEPD